MRTKEAHYCLTIHPLGVSRTQPYYRPNQGWPPYRPWRPPAPPGPVGWGPPPPYNGRGGYQRQRPYEGTVWRSGPFFHYFSLKGHHVSSF